MLMTTLPTPAELDRLRELPTRKELDEWKRALELDWPSARRLGPTAAQRLLLAASTAITLEAQMAKVREFLRDGERVRELMTGSDAYSPANDDRITDAVSELIATLGGGK